jgi:hypothetical protein
LYSKVENVQLGLKLLHKKKKNSNPQVAPSEKVKKPKRFSNYETCITKLINEEPPHLNTQLRKNSGKKP